MKKPVANKRITALLCSVVLLAATIPVSTAAAETTAVRTEAPTVADRSYAYYDYQQTHASATEAGACIEIDAAHFSEGDAAALRSEYAGRTGVLLLDDTSGAFTYTFTAPQDGLYRPEIDYYPIANGSMLDNNVSFRLDGAVPFAEAENVFLSKIYQNEMNDITCDEYGNDVRPTQVEAPAWRHVAFIDNAGYNPDPFLIYLTAGVHTITLAVDQGAVALARLTLNGEYVLPTYAEVAAEYEAAGYARATGELQTYRAELADKKSHLTMYPDRDASNVALEPSDPKVKKLNIIGNGSPGEWISWTVTPIESGLYSIALRVRQNANRGMFNTRRLYINGKVPFAEANTIEFPYSWNWYNYVLGGEETPYLFYMEAGKPYEIALECTTGRFADTLQVVQDVVLDLNALCRRITMVTGMSPDAYRDYEFSEQIPDLDEQFVDLRARLTAEIERLATLMDISGSELSTVDDIIRQLTQFIDDPRSIAGSLNNFRTNVSSLGTWMLNMTNQDISYDSVYLLPEGASLGRAQAGFFSQLWYEVQAVWHSLFSDEQSDADAETITVWAAGVGRDQLNIIRQIVDEDFSAKTGVKVELSLVADSATLLQATLADKGPDIAMFVEESLPVNLAARGALCALDEFDGFDAVRDRFYDSAFVPYTFNGNTYAVPNSQAFNLMFVRTDIFEEMGLAIPNTWDEFYKILPIIQRNGMQVGVGVDGSQMLFETLLLQNGGNLYNDELTATAFDTPEVLEAFKMWTGLYTEYDVPRAYDFFNYFRSGIMPLAIADYTQYNQLAIAAPEIKGLWSIYPIPGMMQADGSIDRTESATGTASVLMRSAENKEAAFRFLDWWSSEATQSTYSRELEATMGPAARYNSANVATLGNLAWKPSEYRIIAEQWTHVWDISTIPSSYYITRNVTNAFRNVVYNNENERETLNKYAKIIDKEIVRKNKELGIGQ